MTAGTSIFLIVIGAILRYAITWKLPAVNVAAVGVILMIAGTVSLAISAAWAFRPNRLKAETDGGPLRTFGKVPPAPRWHTADTNTYAMPVDAHHTGDYTGDSVSPVVAPHVAAPWHDSDADPHLQPYAQPRTEIADTADDPGYGLGTPRRQAEEPAPRWHDPRDLN